MKKSKLSSRSFTTSVVLSILGALLILSGSIHAADISLSTTLDRTNYAPGDTVILTLEIRIPQGFHLYGNPLGQGIGKPLRLAINESPSIRWISALKLPADSLRQDDNDWVWAYTNQARFYFTGVIADKAVGDIKGLIRVEGLICQTICSPVAKKTAFSISIIKKTDSRWFARRRETLKTPPQCQPIAFETETGESAADKAPQALTVFSKINQNGHPASLSIGTRLKDSLQPSNSLDTIDADTMPTWHYSTKSDQINPYIILVLALLAGLILNLTPCVLPVLGIKALSFAADAKESPERAIIKSLVFSAGMISVFIALASLAVFAGFSWGQQFQEPPMQIGIIGLIFIFALGLFDVYTLLPPPVANARQARSPGYTGDFMRGIFTTILATPCGGPFLGAVLAWALLQQPVIVYGVFILIGIGMAAPYILLTLFTPLRRFIPKPGPWMDDVKKVLGFLLLGYAIYLSVGLPAGLQTGAATLCLTLAGCTMIYTRIAPFGSTIRRRISALAIAILVLSAGVLITIFLSDQIGKKSQRDKSSFDTTSQPNTDHTDSTGTIWQPLSRRLLDEAHSRGQDVIVDFTADWCINCQYNTVRVLRAKTIRDLLSKKNALLLEVDMTNRNPVGESLLHHLGSGSIPFLAIFPGNDPEHPVIMRDLLTIKRLSAALQQLSDN